MAKTIKSKTKSLREIHNCLNELADDLADYRLEELSDDLTRIVCRVQDLVDFEARLKEGNETINY